MIVLDVNAYHRLPDRHRAELHLWLEAHAIHIGVEKVFCIAIPDGDLQIILSRYETDATGLIQVANGKPVVSYRQVEIGHAIPAWMHDLSAPPSHQIIAVLRFPRRINPFKEITYTMSDITIKDSDKPISAHLVLLDEAGEPVGADTTPEWETSNPTTAKVVPSADGMTAEIIPGVPGTALITATTTDSTLKDANGDALKIILTGTVIVTAGEAVKGEIEFTAPEAQPAVVAPAGDAGPAEETAATPEPTSESTSEPTADTSGEASAPADTSVVSTPA